MRALAGPRGWGGGKGAGKGLGADYPGSSTPKPLSLLTSLPLPDATAAAEQSTRLLRGLVPFPAVLLAALRAWTADFHLEAVVQTLAFTLTLNKHLK